MPPSKKTAVPKASKVDSLKQVSLMAFVKPTASSFDPTPPVQNTLTTSKQPATVPSRSSPTIIPETPDSKKCSPRIFRSSTGDLVHAPLPSALPGISTSHPYRKPRRSSFVTQRHAHVMEKRAAEGRVSPISRMGDYCSLNYAPIHQNPSSSTPNTFASERARRMVRLAVGETPPAKPQVQVKRPTVLEEETVIEDSVILEDVKSPPPQPRSVKARRLITLNSPEERHLNDMLKEINEKQKSPETVNSKKESESGEKVGESLILEESFFNALDDDWSLEFKDRNLNFGTNYNGKIPEEAKRPWYRCRITDISSKGHSITISAVHMDTKEAITIDLSGTWTDTPARLGNIIHLVPSITDSQSSVSPPPTFHLSDEDHIQSEGTLSSPHSTPRLLILEPEVLISGTTVASIAAGRCSRRAVLQHLWAENEVLESIATESSVSVTTSSASGTSNSAVNVMLVGSVVHEVFQQVVKMRMSGKSTSTREVLFSSIIKPSIILQLYGLGDSPKEFCASLEVFLPKIDQWVKEHCSSNSRTAPSNKPTIKEVLDIEENIWCTKIGVKGKIDMTVMCQIGKELDCSLIPLELKTGKPSFSFEHQGQVLLYLLMLSDRHSDRFQDVAKHGWLVYLRQPDRRQMGQSDLVKPQASSFRGLIQTRNRIAASLKRLIALDDLIPEEGKENAKWSPQLPSPLDRERVCSWCPYLLTCGLFRGESTPPPIDAQLHQMFNDRIKHVKFDHKTFLLHWTRLQLLEYASSNRVDKVLVSIAESTNEATSGAIRGLIVENTSQSTSDSEFVINMVKQDSGQITIQGMSLGGFFIVSSDDSRHVGLCLATLKAVSPSSRSLTICTDRPLPQWITRFRLDRYFADKAVQINLSNLVGLMENSRICAQLRQLIIDQNCPRFTRSLKKSTLLDVRRFLRPLNMHQRRAVLSVLMSKDYTLIEGFPGSGNAGNLSSGPHMWTPFQPMLIYSTFHRRFAFFHKFLDQCLFDFPHHHHHHGRFKARVALTPEGVYIM
ncbi:unnamed protein product, partial [Rodentolepis nana]|uniref:DNA replication ATP-dependent helicase/nuclease n=1 Tax=Rodentolepis nana TaxID=102285 RepID=A0A158QJ09_RODNA